MIYIGVDGGGTKTKIMIYEDDIFLGETVVKDSNLDSHRQDYSAKNILDGIDSLYIDLNLSKSIDSIFLGLGGVPSEANIKSFKSKLKSTHFTKDTIITINNDIINAFESACLGRPGIALIIGTGSVAYGKDESNNTVRVGGVHFHEGDLGSGYDIGITSLRYMSKAFDGRVKKTPFMSYLLDTYKIKNMGDIADLFIRIKNERTEVASIAKVAYSFFEKNDNIAIELFDYKVQDILDHVIAVDKQISLSNREIGIVGSLGNAPLYLNLIKEKVLSYDSTFNVHGALIDPCEGSVRLAKKKTG